MSKPTVAIVGASRDRAKFGNISLHAHLGKGYEVFPVNPSGGEIDGLTCYKSLTEVPARPLDRVSVYLPPHLTLKLLDEIQSMPVGEVWLNPGTADDAVRARAAELGLNVIEACSIVALDRAE
jgi:predicted CoA-binding protein